MASKKTASVLLVTLFVALTLGFIALASAKTKSEERGPAEAAENTNRPQAEFLPVMLRLGGFVPREISRPAGEYVLSVNNQSGVAEVHLRLDRENGERVHEAKVSRRKPYWRQLVRLTPGTYLITEASRPDWVCRIKVTAR